MFARGIERDCGIKWVNKTVEMSRKQSGKLEF